MASKAKLQIIAAATAAAATGSYLTAVRLLSRMAPPSVFAELTPREIWLSREYIYDPPNTTHRMSLGNVDVDYFRFGYDCTDFYFNAPHQPCAGVSIMANATNPPGVVYDGSFYIAQGEPRTVNIEGRAYTLEVDNLPREPDNASAPHSTSMFRLTSNIQPETTITINNVVLHIGHQEIALMLICGAMLTIATGIVAGKLLRK